MTSDAASNRLERLKPLLWCPSCHGDLAFTATEAICGGCARAFAIRQGRIFFCPPPPATDSFDRVRRRLQRLFARFYRTIADVIAPDLPALRGREIRRLFDPAKQIIVDVGSGSQRLHPQMIGVDIVDYANVDVICDLHALPFRPDSIDGATSWGVLEHLRDPFQVVAGLRACTRPGGGGLHMIPFMFPYHPSPADFFRFTQEGLAVLFEGWTMVDLRNPSGPVSLVLLTLVEFLSVVLSGGNPRFKGSAYLVLAAATFPVKILDLPFRNRKSFQGLAPTLLVHVQKPG